MTVATLAAVDLLAQLRAHDHATYSHCLAVGDYAERLAIELGVGAEVALRARETGRLHDVGKIAVPVTVLNSTAQLTRVEYRLLRDHAEVGARMVADDPHACIHADAVCAHHERIDGRGYPRGLRGEQIPLEARIVAVVDTFDALTRGRPYKRAVSAETALTTIYVARRTGHFDPDIVEAFVRLTERSGIRR